FCNGVFGSLCKALLGSSDHLNNLLGHHGSPYDVSLWIVLRVCSFIASTSHRIWQNVAECKPRNDSAISSSSYEKRHDGNSPKHEARSEHECEIEYATLQNSA